MSSTPPHARATRCRVLLIEDDAELRNMMETLFTLEGFEPEVASDGLEALEKLHSAGDLPEVIVLDMMMPRMDGWSFRRQQAREPDLADIPVVVVSAAPREDLVSVNAAAIITKPCDFFKLIDTVREYC